MSRLRRVLLFRGLGDVVGLGSQQVARRNAATAAAALIQRRLEREDVDAYLARRLGDRTHAGTA